MPLAPLTTLGVGGNARYFAQAESEADVMELLHWAKDHERQVFVLGGGSNVLIADTGLDALVIRMRIRGMDVIRTPERVTLSLGAGEDWDTVVAHAVEEGWAGVECLSGIPGAVGATPIQNVGAYGQEVAETITHVHTIDREDGQKVVYDNPGCCFGYRDSLFKHGARNRAIVTRVVFSLTPQGHPAIRYPELRKALGNPGPHAYPSLYEVRATVIGLRRGKSMVIDPSDVNTQSAGSFFTNPTLDTTAFDAVHKRIDAAGVMKPGEVFPHYPTLDGRIKLSAAWLIERAGMAKGTCLGKAAISTKHALALVNRGGATANELWQLACRVRSAVLDRFGVALVPEPVLVGFAPDQLAALGC